RRRRDGKNADSRGRLPLLSLRQVRTAGAPWYFRSVTPRVSVIVRSFNRLGALAELLVALLAQDHDSFEIVVIEQSTERPPEDVARIDALARALRGRVPRPAPPRARAPAGGGRCPPRRSAAPERATRASARPSASCSCSSTTTICRP